MKVSSLTSDNGGFSTLRVMYFWSLLAFGRSFVDREESFVSRPLDIVIAGCKVVALAPHDITFKALHTVDFPTPLSQVLVRHR